MKVIAVVAGCLILLLVSGAHATAPQSAEKTESPKAEPKTDSKKQTHYNPFQVDRLLDAGQYQEAIKEWEKAVAADPRSYIWDTLAWKLAQAYVKLRKYEKAISVFKPYYHIATESVEQRAEIGQKLIFGKIGASMGEKDVAVGKGQCPLCHGFSKNYDLPTPYLNLYGVTKRAKRLIASPQYQQRPKDTKQPEAFPGSGIATNVIEYLAESNVCPSCYVVPGHGVRGTADRESLMPAIHKPRSSLR